MPFRQVPFRVAPQRQRIAQATLSPVVPTKWRNRLRKRRFQARSWLSSEKVSDYQYCTIYKTDQITTVVDVCSKVLRRIVYIQLTWCNVPSMKARQINWWCPYMVINVSVQCNDGLLPDIILLTLCDSIGEPF